MAFNINAQILLSQPKNLNKVANQIGSKLSKVGKIDLQIGNSRDLTRISRQLNIIAKNFSQLNSNLSATRTSISSLNSSFSGLASAANSFGKAQAKVQSQTNATNSSLSKQNALLGNLAGRFGSVARQAIAFGLISRPIYDLQRAFTGAVKDAVAFEKEIVKISQVTGNTVAQLSDLQAEINRLSTELGISANELAETSRIIAQTGRSAAEIKPILEALSRSTLAPTFGRITDTTEGLIAALGQFQLNASDSEAILGSLNAVSKNFAVEAEDLISVIRRTGGVFAQAAGDTKGTIDALQELTAIFTAVRSTTRESADTIAAGLRTIFSRIQRRSTISFLKQFGVDLEDAQGRFVGIFPAFDQLSQKLQVLIKQGDAITLSAIAEELGGIRQIGKLLPAIAEFQKARDAFEIAQQGAVSGLEGDVDKGLQTISNRVDRVKQSFSELIRTLFASAGFQESFKGFLTVTENLLQTFTKIVDTIQPIIPLLTGLGTLKLGQVLTGFVTGGGLGKIGGAASTLTGQAAVQATQQNTSATNQTNQILTRINTQIANLFSSISASFSQNVNQLANLIQINNAGFNNINRLLATRPTTVPIGGFGGIRKSSGGRILGFNRGGIVPGTGNGDTVPAMLEAGEFVIKKSSVNSLGTDTLQAMNENRFEKAGRVFKKTTAAQRKARDSAKAQKGIRKLTMTPGSAGVIFLNKGKGGNQSIDKEITGTKKEQLVNKFPNLRSTDRLVADFDLARGQLDPTANAAVSQATRMSIEKAVVNASEKIIRDLELPPLIDTNEKTAAQKAINKIDFRSIEGFIFEAVTSGVTGADVAGGPAGFDFPNVTGTIRKFDKLFNPKFSGLGVKAIEAKRSQNSKTILGETDSLYSKLINVALGSSNVAASTLGIKLLNKGGGISGQDTIPALLTPGEFVFNKKTASRIGYGNLNRMNKEGITGFNRGGAVGGVQRFANGGQPLSFGSNTATFKSLQDTQQKTQAGLADLGGAAFTATFAVQSFVTSLEDGKVSSGELFNLLLLLAPTVVQLAGNFKGISAGLKKFKSDLLRSGPKTGPGGVPILEPAGTAAARRTARGRLAKGAGVGLGVAATFAGEQVGGTAGGALSGAGSGAAVGSLFGPQGAIAGAAIGGVIGAGQAQQQGIEDKAAKALAAALTDLDQSSAKLAKAIANNTATVSDFSEVIRDFGDLEGAINQQRRSGSLTRGVGFQSFGFDIQEAIGDITTGFSTRTTARDVAIAGEQLDKTSESIQKLGAQATTFIGQIGGSGNLQIGASVNSMEDFGRALSRSNIRGKEFNATIDAFENVIKSKAIDGLKQLERQFEQGFIDQKQLDEAKVAINEIVKNPSSKKTDKSFESLSALAKNLGIDLDFVGQAISDIRTDLLASQLQEATKEINAFGAAITQLNKDISTSIKNFGQEFERIKTLSEGGFATATVANPFENVASATTGELQAGFNLISNQFGVQLDNNQKGLIAFVNKQPEILKQAAQNIAGGSDAISGIKDAFASVTGLSGGLFDTPAFQSLIDQLTELGRQEGSDAGTVLKKFEEQLATGEFDALSGEVGTLVNGFAELINSTNALNKQFDANVDFLIGLQRKELAARLKNAKRIQSFDPFGQRDVFADLDRQVGLASGSFGGIGARTFGGVTDPTALLARREELRERESQLSNITGRDEAQNQELIAVRKELASNTDALTLLKDDTTRLAKINQDLAAIQQLRLQRRQQLSRISTDPNAAQDFFQNEFQALNNILSGRAVNAQQAASIAGLSEEDLAQRIQAQDPTLSDEDALKQAKSIQANIAGEQARTVLARRGIDPKSAEGQAFIRTFQIAAQKRGESVKEARLQVQGNAIIEKQNEIELELATENIESATIQLENSFKNLQTEIDKAVERFRRLNDPTNNPGNNQGAGVGGQGDAVANAANSANFTPQQSAALGGNGGIGGIPDSVAITSQNEVNVNVMGVDTANETFKNEVYGAIAARFDGMRTDANGRPADPSLTQAQQIRSDIDRSQMANFAARQGLPPSTFRTT